ERFLQVGLCSFERALVTRDLLPSRFESLDDRPKPLAELGGPAAQLVVGEFGNLRLERVDMVNGRNHPFHIALVLRAENGGQYFVDHHFSFALPSGRKKFSRGTQEREGSMRPSTERRWVGRSPLAVGRDGDLRPTANGERRTEPRAGTER